MENTVNNTTVVKEIPTISRAGFSNDISNGMTYPQLCDKYKLSIGNIKSITKQLGLQKQVRRNLTPRFVIVD